MPVRKQARPRLAETRACYRDRVAQSPPPFTRIWLSLVAQSRNHTFSGPIPSPSLKLEYCVPFTCLPADLSSPPIPSLDPSQTRLLHSIFLFPPLTEDLASFPPPGLSLPFPHRSRAKLIILPNSARPLPALSLSSQPFHNHPTFISPSPKGYTNRSKNFFSSATINNGYF